MATTTPYIHKLSYQKDGNMVRPDSTFRDFISRDPGSKFPAEKGRYALYLSPGCPWAHRTLIVRTLKHLEDMIDLYMLGNLGANGWEFDGAFGSLTEDPLHAGITHLRDLYLKLDPSFSGRATVPVLWDKKTDTMVNNESSEIIRMLYVEFDDLLPEQYRESSQPGGGLYPEGLRPDIDGINEWVYDTVNNGVYKTGFTASQEAYETNLHNLFGSLDRLEGMLAGHGKPFLLGDHLTEVDIRLYTTAIRFDVAYHSVFMCNLKSIRHDYPKLHLWLRRLYWDQGERFNGAFYKTTQPWIGLYSEWYAKARQRIVTSESVLIVPSGPAVKVEKLREGESL
ncbi:glutathione S-transferase [Xylariales sp. AK1849]|nr:glutathione S-transferase [Xylariales sp. AK1849]